MNLSARDVASRRESGMPLSHLPLGESAVVSGLAAAGDPATARRLFDLGFSAGTPVTVVRRTPLGGPRIYRVGDYELALRRAQASTILVTA